MTNGTPDDPRNGQRPEGHRWLVRSLGFLVLVALLVAAYASGLHNAISLDALRENREILTGWVAERPVLAGAAFLIAYVVFTSVSLPVGAVMTILGGFLFGTWVAASLVVFGATIGATIVFLAARTAFAEPLRARAGRFVKPMEEGFRHNAFSYMLTLRLIPFFPFWVINLVPALLGVPLGTFVAATFIGIIPATAVYAGLGDGLGVIFDQGGTPDIGIIFKPDILLPLLGLAALALLPAIYRIVKKHRREASR